MLSNEDLLKLIEAIMKRGDREYTSPSGAFLELLREFANDGKILEMAEVCASYIRTYPEAAHFVSAQVGPTLVNSYFPFLQEFPYDSFIEWSAITPNWSEQLRNTFANYQLFPLVVRRLIESVKKYASEK